MIICLIKYEKGQINDDDARWVLGGMDFSLVNELQTFETLLWM